eukprot:3754917-Prorocentrum_lima.AAC.1
MWATFAVTGKVPGVIPIVGSPCSGGSNHFMVSTIAVSGIGSVTLTRVGRVDSGISGSSGSGSSL